MTTTFWFLRFLVVVGLSRSYFRALLPKRAFKIFKKKTAIYIMELPTSNRKKVINIWLTGKPNAADLSQKTTLFPFFGGSYQGNCSTYIAENLHRFFFKYYLQCKLVCQISSKSGGGGVTRTQNSKSLDRLI